MRACPNGPSDASGTLRIDAAPDSLALAQHDVTNVPGEFCWDRRFRGRCGALMEGLAGPCGVVLVMLQMVGSATGRQRERLALLALVLAVADRDLLAVLVDARAILCRGHGASRARRDGVLYGRDDALTASAVRDSPPTPAKAAKTATVSRAARPSRGAQEYRPALREQAYAPYESMRARLRASRRPF